MADQKKYVNILSKKAISDNVEPQQIIASLNIVPNKEGQTITASGIVAGYSPINVSGVNASIDENIQPENIREGVNILGVEGTAECPEYYRDFKVVNGELTQDTTVNKIMNLNGVTSLGAFCMANAYYNNKNLTGAVDLSGIESVDYYSCYYAFSDCRNITSVDLSSLIGVNGQYACYDMFARCINITSANLSSLKRIITYYGCTYMFYGCTSLTDIDLSSLEEIGGTGVYICQGMFQNCTSLTSINLSSLKRIISGGSAFVYIFAGCTSLTDVDLSSLEEITGMYSLRYAFSDCTSLTTLSFPALKSDSFGSSWNNQFNGMLSGVTGCTVHFPSNLQSVIGSWADVTNGFGGTNTTVLFDLPATE